MSTITVERAFYQPVLENFIAKLKNCVCIVTRFNIQWQAFHKPIPPKVDRIVFR